MIEHREPAPKTFGVETIMLGTPVSPKARPYVVESKYFDSWVDWKRG